MTKADINRHIYTLTQPFPNAALKRHDNALRLEADYESARVYWSRWDRRRGPSFLAVLGRRTASERVRLIGVLLQATENDLESEARVKAFLHGLEQLGWTEGRNLKLEYRWAGGNSDDIRKHAAELVALAPDILVAAGSATVGALQQATRTVPIVFATEYAIGARWLELLREISPSTTRVAVLRDPAVATGPGQFGARYKPPRPRSGWR
jgi:ABC transporter substrate binding protein